jgi:MFS family permease
MSNRINSEDESNAEIRPLLSNSSSINTPGQQTASEPNVGVCSSLFDPRKSYYRYFGLVFICMLTFGPYFCFVIPSALEAQFERDLSISTTQYTLFNSLYSWPNIVLCFFGGILIDRVFGIRYGTIWFSITVTAGQALFGYGAYVNNMWLMYVGRFVFG